MLDDLVSVIETLQKRIGAHGATLRENETRTRMALIDPLLTALGWDVSDPALVTPEYDVSGRKADYALLGTDGQPAATLEAKKLGESLASHRMQMLNYSNASGVEYAGLTDGDHWELYEVFQRGQLEDRRILEVSISGMPAHEIALKMLLLWQPNLASSKPVAASEPLVGLSPVPQSQTTPAPEPAPSVATPRLISPEPAPVIATPSLQAGWVSLSEFNPPGGSKPPTAIRFPDGSEQEIKRWNDILVTVAGWLYDSGRLTAADEPVHSSSKIYIAHNRPIHPTGNEFFQYRTIANGQVAVNTHGSAIQMRKNSQTLLARYAVSPDTVQLQVEQ